jgi:hypothetical protein
MARIDSVSTGCRQIVLRADDPARRHGAKQRGAGDAREAVRVYFRAFWAITFAHLAFMAAEILALAAALILAFLGRAAFLGAPPPDRPFSSFCKRSICCRIATARLSCLTDNSASELMFITIQ